MSLSRRQITLGCLHLVPKGVSISICPPLSCSEAHLPSQILLTSYLSLFFFLRPMFSPLPPPVSSCTTQVASPVRETPNSSTTHSGLPDVPALESNSPGSGEHQGLRRRQSWGQGSLQTTMKFGFSVVKNGHQAGPLCMCLPFRSCLNSPSGDFPFQKHILIFNISTPKHMPACHTAAMAQHGPNILLACATYGHESSGGETISLLLWSILEGQHALCHRTD